MDLKKILLITGLVIVGYLIILKWSQDSQKETTAATTTPVSHHNTPASIAPDHKPSSGDAPAPVINKNSDVPSLSGHNDKHPEDQNMITVSTDNLQVKINPLGGNIVYLALPDYPKKQGEKAPFVLLDHNRDLTYIAQSGLTGQNGPDIHGAPLYKAENHHYVMKKNQDVLNVNLNLDYQGVKITKRYTFKRGDYGIGLGYVIQNPTNKPWSGNFYAQLKRDNSADPGLTGSHGTSITSYLGAAVKTNDSKFKKLKFQDFASSPFSGTTQGGYAAILQHYFVAAWVPEQKQSYTYMTRAKDGNNFISLIGAATTVQPGKTTDIQATLYAGPKIGHSLEKLAPGLELTIDYGWLWFIAGPMFAVLAFLHTLLGNWGWSIIVLTALIKLIFYPLSAASYRSMAKMRALQPKMQALKERYGDDRQKMSQELMGLYKKEKVNPMGGCLPIVVQMPFFIALYEVLMEAVQLRQTPWMFWIHDLSRMDPYFILPIIMGGLMLIQQRLSPAPPDPTQAKIMRLMPIMFTIFFLWFPAGLVIYWVTNNFLSILQQWWITKKCEQQALPKK